MALQAVCVPAPTCTAVIRRSPRSPRTYLIFSHPSFLGQNSKRMRLQRQLVELQTRLRLHTTGSKDDVRQSYVPGLLSLVVDPILQRGQEAIPEVIQAMDEYYLIPEDRDTLVELELGSERRREDQLKKLSAPVKAAFTRAYNAGDQYVSMDAH